MSWVLLVLVAAMLGYAIYGLSRRAKRLNDDMRELSGDDGYPGLFGGRRNRGDRRDG
ncbi:MAG: hypothetical protein JO147_01975 [Actinobacteria bacterium]|nr:hypothetical protein [Actinomycetota bacterium]